jgi:PAS domain S-box-containing protein
MKKNTRTLFSEMQLLILSISMLIIIGCAGVFLFVVSHMMLKDLRTRSVASVESLAAFLEYPLYAIDNEQAIRVAETFLASETISRVVLESTADGQLLSKGTGRESRWIQTLSREIHRDGLLLGRITVTFNDDEITQFLYRFGVIFFGILVAVFVANIAAQRLIISKRVKQPFIPIMDGIRSISGGNYQTRIAPSSYPDINMLASFLNDMAEKIHRKNREQEQTLTALEESERKTRAIFDLSFGFIGLLTPEGLIVDANRSSLDFAGVSLSDVLGKPLWETPWWAHSKEARQQLRDAVRSAAQGELLRFETTHLGADGRTHTIDFSLKPVQDEMGRTILLIPEGRDITEQKRSEKEKGELQEQLLQVQKMESIGRLAGGVAHDFNNMLSAILGHAELAMLDCDPEASVYAALERITEAAHRSGDLVRQLLAFARKQTVTPKVLDLNRSLGDMLKMLERLIGEQIVLNWLPAGDLWPVKIDPSQLDQVLANLCINARDAIKTTGKITIETGNRTFDRQYCDAHKGFIPGDYVMLSVSDDGCGMDKTLLDYIFEPFFTTKEAGSGTGLGLSTVYGIVKQNEGFVNVYSEPGKGSTFRLYLPRTGEGVPEPETEKAAVVPSGSGETVLVVDDEPIALDVSAAMMSQLGYSVLTAATPTEAIREAKAHADDLHLLVTDVVLPEMNGRELANKLGDMIPGLKCLYASGYSANVIGRDGILPEEVNFIQKPFSLQNLAEKVRQALSVEKQGNRKQEPT